MAAEHPEAAKQLSVVAENVGSHLPEVSRDIGEFVIAEVPELRGDPTVIKILQASVAENVATLLHVFENDMPLDNIVGPASALEYARRLAQRGMPLSALIRPTGSATGVFCSGVWTNSTDRTPTTSSSRRPTGACCR